VFGKKKAYKRRTGTDGPFTLYGKRLHGTSNQLISVSSGAELTSLEFRRLFVWNIRPEFLLECHRELDGVEAVYAKIFDEPCGWDDHAAQEISQSSFRLENRWRTASAKPRWRDSCPLTRPMLQVEATPFTHLFFSDLKPLIDDPLHAILEGFARFCRVISLNRFVFVRLRDALEGGVVERSTGSLGVLRLAAEVDAQTRVVTASQAKRSRREAADVLQGRGSKRGSECSHGSVQRSVLESGLMGRKNDRGGNAQGYIDNSGMRGPNVSDDHPGSRIEGITGVIAIERMHDPRRHLCYRGVSGVVMDRVL